MHSTWINIINMCQYIVVKYKMKPQKCVAVFGFTVYDESSES